jgi:tripartite-type tricarboxylate transporter receptor subunit TctC
MMRRILAVALVSPLLSLLLSLLTVTVAWAQNYPNRPVRVVVPAATGGPDIVARVVAAQLQAQLGQPFVVENRPGANGILGADVVAKAPPDGYTLMVYSSGFVINPFVHKSLPYDTEKDFTPVTNLVSNGGLFFAVHPSVPAKNLQEFIELARKPDSKFAYSTPGVGNTWHLAMEVFKNVTGTHMTHIPYKGGGPAAAALVAGEVQAMFTSPAPIMPHYKNGRVRVLAYTGAKRHPSAPEVPTTAEAGVPQYRHDGGWFAMFAPANTPMDIVEKLYREVRTAMQNPGVREKLAGLGVEPVADTPAEFKKFVAAELRAYAEQVRLAGVTPE